MPSDEKTPNDPYALFQPGDNVKHPKFGVGTIMQRSGSDNATKFIVAFAEEGEKRLMARYAKLKRLHAIETKEGVEEKSASEEKSSAQEK